MRLKSNLTHVYKINNSQFIKLTAKQNQIVLALFNFISRISRRAEYCRQYYYTIQGELRERGINFTQIFYDITKVILPFNPVSLITVLILFSAQKAHKNKQLNKIIFLSQSGFQMSYDCRW